MNLIEELNKLADNGYCPALLFDDDGRWALSFTGTQPVNFESKPMSMYTTFFVETDDWKDTIEEAVEHAIKKFEVNYK